MPAPCQPTPSASASGRLPGLSGVRGLAVLLVLLDHAGDARMRLFDAADLNRAGKYGVYLFFVLSAFLLTHGFAHREAAAFFRWRTWADYALRRFLRIFPPYAVVIVAYVLMHKLKWHQAAEHLLLRDGVGQFWTIPVEVKFYVLLPGIVFALFGAGRRHWALGAATAIGVAALAWGFAALDRIWSLREPIQLVRNLAPFLCGVGLALLYGRLLRIPGSARRMALPLELGAVAAATAIAFRIPAIHEALPLPQLVLGKEWDSEVGGALCAMFLLGVLLGKGWVRRALEWAPLHGLGVISFSVYLWHRRFLGDMDDFPAPSPVRLALYLALVVAVGTVSWWLLERPLARLRWGRRPARA